MKLNCKQASLLLAGAFGAVSLIAAPEASASAVQIIGSLGNFDVYNRTGNSVDGFEIEIHGLSQGGYLGSWNYSYFGRPTETYYSDLGDGSSGYRIVYSNNLNPSQSLLSGGLTHFGIHYSGSTTGINYDWLKRDVSNNLVRVATPPPSTPPTPASPPPPAPAVLPTPVIEVENEDPVTHAPLPQPRVTYTVRNENDRPIWVLAGKVPVNLVGNAELGNLMANPSDLLQDPDAPTGGDAPPALFEGLSYDLFDPDWELLDPGEHWAQSTGGAQEEVDDDQTTATAVIFWAYDYTGDLKQEDNDPRFYKDCRDCTVALTRGALNGTMMAAVNTAPVPVPAALWLFGSALGGFGLLARKRKASSAA
ncbi:VPLPA-CTERM sorting domain-containing protein [Methylococcus sp. EFPC2]|uniref:VPLPA-CTERM sorting domain-containing protein n=1 Tax=Methylococcus sp. EFPC2 TaxID=2812648 RepID=UPI001967F165|nr:VPLPA-CTERM sorting domain-containing protein [Methylococcus sp. EFPC2]QSA97626.1 VPLPA-CTERM sorting domain-containing protein [Methylococcus sp. EFPC2]